MDVDNFITAPSGTKTRLICVPSFSETQSVAVVNLRTLDCQVLNFKVNEFDWDADDENMDEK